VSSQDGSDICRKRLGLLATVSFREEGVSNGFERFVNFGDKMKEQC